MTDRQAAQEREAAQEKEESQHRTFVNLVAAITVLVLAIAAIWLLGFLDDIPSSRQKPKISR